MSRTYRSLRTLAAPTNAAPPGRRPLPQRRLTVKYHLSRAVPALATFATLLYTAGAPHISGG